VRTFLNLKIGEVHTCKEIRTGRKLQGKVIDAGTTHARIEFPDGSTVLLNEKSDVFVEAGTIRFNG